MHHHLGALIIGSPSYLKIVSNTTQVWWVIWFYASRKDCFIFNHLHSAFSEFKEMPMYILILL